MIKKVLTSVFVFIICSIPAFAYRDLCGGSGNQIRCMDVKLNSRQKVEVLGVNNALEIRVAMGRMRGPVYVANLDCHEFSKMYTLKSGNTITYALKRSSGVKSNSKASDYISRIFANNRNNIYFVPRGYGLYENFVGEFYIGNQSLSRHLIDKGYCSYIR